MGLERGGEGRGRGEGGEGGGRGAYCLAIKLLRLLQIGGVCFPVIYAHERQDYFFPHNTQSILFYRHIITHCTYMVLLKRFHALVTNADLYVLFKIRFF